MQRPLEDRVDRAELDDPAEIHHQHPVADVAHDVEVVADEDIGQVELALQRAQQVEHLRLDRFVERRDRLVEDHHARLGGERAGDVDALLLPARQLVRIARAEQIGVEPDLAEDVAGDVARLGLFRPWMNGPNATESRTGMRGLSEE